jgi:hypothetical protein
MRDSKVSNVAITIDKVMHVLRTMGTLEPPIREMSYKEVMLNLIILFAEIPEDLGRQR